MWTRPGRRLESLTASVSVVAVLSGCASGAETAGASSAGPTPTTSVAPAASSTPSAVPPPDSSRIVNWFDLTAGDCLADPPPTDPTVITVKSVDCATAHQAEAYLRAPMAVNNALADVADRICGAGFFDYTGQTIAGSPFSTTYLIDSNQNRTSSNPNPSTVICLLQAADGAPLTGSARR